MSAPWSPSPNPGGNNRRLVRTIMREWVQAQNIAGLEAVWSSWVPTFDLESLATPGPYAVLRMHVGKIVERRRAITGVNDPGGKDADYEVTWEMIHRSSGVENSDWEDAEDDHDRILGALQDSLHAQGRNFGRPDVILQAADWPEDESLTIETPEPYAVNGLREQVSTLSFIVSQYMQRQP